MTTSCKTTSTSPHEPQMVVLDEYKANFGTSFDVFLIGAVRQILSDNGEILETRIPNMSGLLKEVALSRSLCARKFSPGDIKFLRKAFGLKALDLADLLGVSAEHLSRCENGDRALSMAAEKLLRIIIIKKRFNYASINEELSEYLKSDALDTAKIEKFRVFLEEYNECFADLEKAIFDSKLEAVYDPDDKLALYFHLREHVAPSEEAGTSQDDEQWQRKKAA